MGKDERIVEVGGTVRDALVAARETQNSVRGYGSRGVEEVIERRLLEALMPIAGVTLEERLRKANLGPLQIGRMLRNPALETKIWKKVWREIFVPSIPEIARSLVNQATSGKRGAYVYQKMLLTLLSDQSPIRERAGLDEKQMSDEDMLAYAKSMRLEFDKMVRQIEVPGSTKTGRKRREDDVHEIEDEEVEGIVEGDEADEGGSDFTKPPDERGAGTLPEE